MVISVISEVISVISVDFCDFGESCQQIELPISSDLGFKSVFLIIFGKKDHQINSFNAISFLFF